MKTSQQHSDAYFYEAALNEIQSGTINRGLMIKAAAKSGNDRRKAEALYVEWRAKLLEEESIILEKKADEDRKAKDALLARGSINEEVAQRAKDRVREVKETKKEAEKKATKDTIGCLFGIIFGVIALAATPWLINYINEFLGYCFRVLEALFFGKVD